MAVLHPEGAVFYHPLDSLADSAASAWSTAAPGTASTFTTPGKVGGYMTRPSTPAAQIANAAYPGSGSVTRYTMAAWATMTTGDFYLGAISADSAVWQVAQLFSNGSILVYYGSGASSFGLAPIGTVPTINDGSFNLYVLDLEISGTSWTLRHSVNGAPFTAESPVTHPAFANAPAYGLIGTRCNLDEAVLWRNLADPFTPDELANLHDLADTFGLGMDQYSEQYEAPICWQATASMPDGTVWRDSGSGPCPAVVRVPRGASDIIVTDDGRPMKPRIQEG